MTWKLRAGPPSARNVPTLIPKPALLNSLILPVLLPVRLALVPLLLLVVVLPPPLLLLLLLLLLLGLLMLLLPPPLMVIEAEGGEEYRPGRGKWGIRGIGGGTETEDGGLPGPEEPRFPTVKSRSWPIVT